MKVSTTDQVQDWLTENTFECAALGARMDLEQCLSNRMKAQGLQFPGLLTACIRCERAGGGNGESEPSAVTVGAEQIATKGMDWLKAPDPEPMPRRLLPVNPPFTLNVSFVGYEAEYEKLRDLSESDGHSLADDALTILLLFIHERLMILEE